MTAYILIDSHTGYVWGGAYAESPEQACETVDAQAGGRDAAAVTYTAHGPQSQALRNGADGYFVYEAPRGWRFTGPDTRTNLFGESDPELSYDGQDPAVIARVEALPLVAQVTVTPRAGV